MKINNHLLAKQTGTNRDPDQQSNDKDSERNATRHPHARTRSTFQVLEGWHRDTLLLSLGTT